MNNKQIKRQSKIQSYPIHSESIVCNRDLWCGFRQDGLYLGPGRGPVYCEGEFGV